MTEIRLEDIEKAAQLRASLEELVKLIEHALRNSVHVLPKEGQIFRAVAHANSILESK